MFFLLSLSLHTFFIFIVVVFFEWICKFWCYCSDDLLVVVVVVDRFREKREINILFRFLCVCCCWFFVLLFGISCIHQLVNLLTFKKQWKNLHFGLIHCFAPLLLRGERGEEGGDEDGGKMPSLGSWGYIQFCRDFFGDEFIYKYLIDSNCLVNVSISLTRELGKMTNYDHDSLYIEYI